jgi:hypothetical protein
LSVRRPTLAYRGLRDGRFFPAMSKDLVSLSSNNLPLGYRRSPTTYRPTPDPSDAK